MLPEAEVKKQLLVAGAALPLAVSPRAVVPRLDMTLPQVTVDSRCGEVGDDSLAPLAPPTAFAHDLAAQWACASWMHVSRRRRIRPREKVFCSVCLMHRRDRCK